LEASLSRPGVVTFQRLAFARWSNGRGAFIDMADPATAAAGVGPGMETATIYAHVLDHPRHGRFLIDTGASAALEGRVGPVMRWGLRQLSPTVLRTTTDTLADSPPIQGVFLTHLHFDHSAGLIDVAPGTPIHIGPGDARERNRLNLLLGSPANAILRGHGPLNEWAFRPDPSGAFEGVLDIFGDGSVWALHVPGHSPGSTAYLINTTEGPKLVTGDAVSTRLEWAHALRQVGPDPDTALRSAERIRRFAAAHPGVEILLGHQTMGDEN
jgi:N-acyl homoserine lactone hydrolase